MNFDNMVSTVIETLRSRQEPIQQRYWTNANRNHIIVTDKRHYLLKWNDRPFQAAGRLVQGLGAGIGLTVDYETATNYEALNDCHILFSWTATNKIYYQTMEQFKQLSKPYTQKSGEREKVILVTSLKPWQNEV